MKKVHLYSLLKSLAISIILYTLTLLLTYFFLFTGNKLFIEYDFYSYEVVDTLRSLTIFSIIFILCKKFSETKCWNPNKSSFPKTNLILFILIAPLLFRVCIDPIIWINENFRFPLISDNEDYTNGIGIFNNILIFFSTVILVPVIEEIIFRGLILKNLKPFKINVRILMSSLLFTLIHLPSDTKSLIIVFILGFILGGISMKTSLIYAIIFHAVYNFIWYLLNLYPEPYRQLIKLLKFEYTYWIIIATNLSFLTFMLKKIWINKKY